MPVVVSQLWPATVLTAVAATIYTMPASPSTITLSRGRARFTNTDTVQHTVTAYAIQSGGTAIPGNCFMNAEIIAPNTHLDIDIPVLTVSGFIQAFADVANHVTMFQLDGILFS
jgi:hypothetical protein